MGYQVDLGGDILECYGECAHQEEIEIDVVGIEGVQVQPCRGGPLLGKVIGNQRRFALGRLPQNQDHPFL